MHRHLVSSRVAQRGSAAAIRRLTKAPGFKSSLLGLPINGHIPKTDWRRQLVTPRARRAAAMPSKEEEEAGQQAFDALVVRAILQFANPEDTSLHGTQLFRCLKQADPSFEPEQYGAPDWVVLLRNCRFLQTSGGRLQFQRQYADDEEEEEATTKRRGRGAPREPACVGLLPFEYSQGPRDRSVRKPPTFTPSHQLRWR